MLTQLTHLLPSIMLAGFVIFVIFDCLTTNNQRSLLRQSYKTNFQLFFVNSVILTLLPIIAVNYQLNTGLLSDISNPVYKMVLSFLALDLILYYGHRICHTYDILWMFHRVHHNDKHVNVSTSFRLHFLELIFTNIIKSFVIVLMGIDQIITIINEAVTTLFVMFHHSSISFKGEKWLSKVIIVPSVHRVHHSINRHEHDSNYGAILSIWDKIFGTFIEPKPVQVGIKTSSPQDVVGLIKFGLLLPDTSTPLVVEQSIPQFLVSVDEMIATAAYYRAEKRGFQHGDDQLDWFEAQREIEELISCAA